MKKGKILALLLSLIMLCSVIPETAVVAEARNSEGEETVDDGVVLNKFAAPNYDEEGNFDGSYKITLEAYATGSKIIGSIKKDVPTDIILVLDQSGSMKQDMGTYNVFHEYDNRTNSDLFRYRSNNDDWNANRNLYYRREDGSYVSVSVDRVETAGYERSDYGTNRYFYENKDNLYISKGENEFQQVELTRNRHGSYYKYTYKLDGKTIAESDREWGVPNFDSYGSLYVYKNDAVVTYTYSYTDGSGEKEEIETSEGEDTVPDSVFYYSRRASVTKISALKAAVTSFVENVNQKAAGEDGVLETEDDINHRIAVVGFASESGNGNNTELLSISGSNSGNVGIQYSRRLSNKNYQDVVQDMNTSGGQTMVEDAIEALATNGATRADLGMEMAKNILQNNPVDQGEKRNRVVIFFTDGVPTTFQSFDNDIATDAISYANYIKEMGADVYSIGIFSGADATDPGKDPTVDYRPWEEEPTETQKCNWFMQEISSNDGTPQTPSYYLSAADAETLNSIFQQISDNIEQGGSKIELDETAVVKDVLSPYFSLEGVNPSDIDLATYKYTGEGNDPWAKNDEEIELTVEVNSQTGEVEVTGFDFAENYVGTVTEDGKEPEYVGNKLVISFDVIPKEGFLGGNNVPTNIEDIPGIYENKEAVEENTPIDTFEVPVVDVPIPEIIVDAPDRNIYLYGDVAVEDLIKDTSVTAGGQTLDLSADDYGLESWKTDYVEIESKYTIGAGEISGETISDLEQDISYSATIEISPKYNGTYKKTEGTDTGKINVYKPELTFGDSTVYYGDTAPENYNTKNLVSTVWKHGETVADETTMGTAPTLSITYEPEEGKIVNKIINTKEDIIVDATVELEGKDIKEHTKFIHEDCEGEEGGPVDGKFWLHVKTCDLTIVKTGGANDEPYVFEISKDGDSYTEITITGNDEVTISELPVGNYSIQEAGDWSWRYRPTYKVNGNEGNSATLSGKTPSATITCTNKKYNDHWLNDFSTAVKNVYGEAHSN